MPDNTPQNDSVRTIKTPLGDGIELIIPDDPKALITEETTTLYGREKLEATCIRADESFHEYLERLKTLYPDQAQTAYLDALFMTSLSAAQSMEAFMFYVEGKTRPINDKTLQTYPEHLNTDIVGMGYPQNHAAWVIAMDPEWSNELMRHLNYASYVIRNRGRDILAQARDGFVSMLKGHDPHLPIALRLKIAGLVQSARFTIGDEIYEIMAKEAAALTITPDSIGLLTDNVANHMSTISKMMGSRFIPTHFLAESIFLRLALDNLEMPRNIITHCLEVAVDREIETE